MEDRLASGDFTLTGRYIRTEDVTVINHYSDNHQPAITQAVMDLFLFSSKAIVDAALNKAEVKARQMQEADRWNRKVLTGGKPVDLFDPALHKTPSDTIRMILLYPEMAGLVLIAPDETSDMETLLLDKVARAFRQIPGLTASTLIARWYGTPEGDLLQGIVSR